MCLPKVFMIGWEFPPFNSGGLGTACQGLTRALAFENIEQIFVLPKKLPVNSQFLEIVYPETPLVTHVHINMQLYPYGNFNGELFGQASRFVPRYFSNMVDEAYEYAKVVGSIATHYPHDIIHGHDWMTYPAALAARDSSHKPVVLHVHSTEYDRTLDGHINPEIEKIEKHSLHNADQIIAVSQYTKDVVCDRYHIPNSRISVVHNGVDLSEQRKFHISDQELQMYANGKKVVIFVGRLTGQKGPDYFIRIADRITHEVPEALFVVAGNGDMFEQILMQSAGHRLTGKLLFTGFLRNRQREFLYRRADLFIMPSVSEPFGIVALEAAAAHTPIIISKQSGVREVMNHALSANYWDVNEISNQAISILKSPDYQGYLAYQCAKEADEITWGKAAKKCVNVYQKMMGNI